MESVEHEHQFDFVGSGTHFAAEPNSKRQPKGVYKYACACGQRGFRYNINGALFTWTPVREDWLTEL